MSKTNCKPATAVQYAADKPADSAAEQGSALADAFVQIRESRDRIVAAVIQRAVEDGSYQHAKWLFEFGGIVSCGHNSPEDEPSLVRLLLDQLQIPETPEELAAEFAEIGRAHV